MRPVQNGITRAPRPPREGSCRTRLVQRHAPRARRGGRCGHWLVERSSRRVVDVCPLSDGGDGVLEVIGSGPGWRRYTGTVGDPPDLPVAASWIESLEQACVESAKACGLHLVPPTERHPIELTTYGVGQLMSLAAPEGGSPDREVIVGLGGSATVDGGLGMLAALGSWIRAGWGGALVGSPPRRALRRGHHTFRCDGCLWAAEGNDRRRGHSSFAPSCRLGRRGGA